MSINASEIDLIYEQFIKDKIPITTAPPKLIITYGPPSSGKGYIVDDFILKELAIPTTSIITANIDEVISKIKGYQEEIAVCKKYFSDVIFNSDVDDAWTTKCTAIYNKYRTGTPTESADQVVEKLLKYGMDKKLNIVFETTGGNVAWTINNLINDAKKQGYVVYIVYPIVDTEILVKRLLARARIEGRYPKLDYVKYVIEKAQNNIVTVIPHVDFIYIYDNNCSLTKMIIIKKLSDDKYNVSCQKDKLYEFLDNRTDVFRKEILKLCSTGTILTGGFYNKYIKYQNKIKNLKSN